MDDSDNELDFSALDTNNSKNNNDEIKFSGNIFPLAAENEKEAS